MDDELTLGLLMRDLPERRAADVDLVRAIARDDGWNECEIAEAVAAREAEWDGRLAEMFRWHAATTPPGRRADLDQMNADREASLRRLSHAMAADGITETEAIAAAESLIHRGFDGIMARWYTGVVLGYDASRRAEQ